METKVQITTEFITLGQFLKFESILPSGGIVKLFLEDNNILVNGEKEIRRGRKLYPNDLIEVEGMDSYRIVK